MMPPVRTLVLDFDGVILESNSLKTDAFEAVFSRFPEHLTTMMAFHHGHVSESRFVKFRYLATACLGRREDDAVVDELAAAFTTETRKRLETCPMVPGAQEFLDRVRGRLPVYLASMTPQDDLDQVLRARGFAPVFTHAYGCPPWTKERAIAEIISREGADGLLFVGDSAGDQRAALRTGVEFIVRDSGLAFDDPRPPSYRNLHTLLAAIDHRLP